MTMQKKKKNKYKTNSANHFYLASAVITGILGFVTPLISFEFSIFGFATLIIFIAYTMLKSKAQAEVKLIAVIMVLLASHRLLFYVFIIISFPCIFSTCDFGYG